MCPTKGRPKVYQKETGHGRMANLCEGDILKLARGIQALQKRLIWISEGRNKHVNFDRAFICFSAQLWGSNWPTFWEKDPEFFKWAKYLRLWPNMAVDPRLCPWFSHKAFKTLPYICIYIYIYIFIYTIYIYIYLYTQIYIFIHTNIYIYIHVSSLAGFGCTCVIIK